MWAQTLQHRYSFVSDASDSVGHANGTLVAPNGGSPATTTNGLNLPGGGGGGFSGYCALPSGILTTTTNLTIECWATQNAPNTWATIWDFGNNGSQNFELCPDPNRNNNDMIVAFTPNGNEVDLFTPISFPNGSEEYVAVTYNNSTLTANLYYNGALNGTVTLPNATYAPGSIGGAGGTTENWLGNDVYGDTQYQGTIYELRIWNGVVPQRQIAASAILGSGTLVTNLTPTSVSVTAGPSVIISGTEQAAVSVQLPQTGASELSATGDATNWTSSNPAILEVNSRGVISGVGVGTAKISATVGGVTGTTGTITVTGPQTLLHRYSFVSDATDSVGGANGTNVPPNGGAAATITNGLSLPGNQNGGFGYSGYVALPSGILTNTTSLTIDCWVTQTQGNGWAELWDFGNNGSQNFGLIPYPQNNGTHMEVAFTPNGSELDLQSAVAFPNGSEQYVCLTYNNYTLAGNLYTNGSLVASRSFPNTTYCPGTIGGPGGTTENSLGNDVYGDWQFSGTIYEFRIWNGALTPVYAAVSAAAGPSVVVTNLTPLSLNVTVTNTSMVGAQTQPATVVGNFVDASGVTVTDGATNWTSSNTNVLTVNSSGLITAVSGGSATVSATVDGVTATSPTISVATTAPIITQAPVNQTVAVGQSASFSVQALGGGLGYQWSFDATPIPGATSPSLSLANVALTNSGTYSVVVSNNIGTTNASAVLTVVQQYLAHRYSFVSDASDSVGGANGAIVPPAGSAGGTATINNGLFLPGNQNGGFGYSGYVSLPGGLLTNTSSLTVECWVTQNQQNTWAEIWDFGNSGSQNFGLIPYPANNGNNMEVAFTPHGNEVDLQSAVAFPNGSEQYVCLTFNSATLTGDLYTNGTLVASRTFPDSTYIPGTIGGAGGTLENMLGNDVYGDWQFSGTIYEFRIWDGAVSPLYIAVSAIAGPGVVETNLTSTSVSVTVTNATELVGQSENAAVTADFNGAAGVAVTGSATNWTSSNTNVLTVDTNGLITAVGSGSATISTTVNGVSGTSGPINVPTSAPIITSEPADSESLLVGGTFNATVGVIGNTPLTFYWFLNSSSHPVSVITSPTLTIPNIQMTNAGTYTCIVSNQFGTTNTTPLVLTVIAPTPYQQSVLDLNPLGYWPLQETTGTIAYDMANGYNGTYIGGFTLAQPGPTNLIFGASSYSALFDGFSGFVDIPEGPFNITGAITIMAWVNLQAAPAHFTDVFAHGDASWRLSVNQNSPPQPGAADGSAPDATDTTGINPGDWHMLAYSYTGGVGNNLGVLYVDAVPVAFDSFTATPVGDNLDVWIAGAPDYGTSRLIPAEIAHCAIYTQALTAAEIRAVYKGESSAPVNLTIKASNGSVTLTWPNGMLLQAPTVNGPWATNNALSPYTIPAAAGQQYFRVQVSQ